MANQILDAPYEMLNWRLHPTLDERRDLEQQIHEAYLKFATVQAQAVEALCLAYLVKMGDTPIQDWMLVKQSTPDGLGQKIWLQRKDAPIGGN